MFQDACPHIRTYVLLLRCFCEVVKPSIIAVEIPSGLLLVTEGSVPTNHCPSPTSQIPVKTRRGSVMGPSRLATRRSLQPHWAPYDLPGIPRSVQRPHTLVLFSGGLDSTVLLTWALRRGRASTLSLEWPGRPRGERRAARRIADQLDVETRIEFPLPSLNGASRSSNRRDGYVPARNLFLHSTAAFVARQIGASEIAAGHLASDAEAFPDANRRYLEAVTRLANAGRARAEPPLRLRLPFAALSKNEVVALGRRLNAPLDLSWSCFRDGPHTCGRCESCRERRQALASLP